MVSESGETGEAVKSGGKLVADIIKKIESHDELAYRQTSVLAAVAAYFGYELIDRDTSARIERRETSE